MKTEVVLIANFLGIALLAGLVGTIGMIVFFHILNKATNSQMVLAVGSLLTRSREHAFLVGIFVHGMLGVLFACGYLLILMFLIENVIWTGFFLGGLIIGFVHGLIVALTIVAGIGGRHPLPEFRNADLLVGIIHLGGHVIYGGLVGLISGLLLF